MKKSVLFACGLFLILLISIHTGGPVSAAEVMEMPPRTEVPVNLRLVDEERNPLTGEKTVMVEVTRGGLKDPAVLTSGLLIKDGIGHFVYITPATPGSAEIRIVDPETREVMEKIIFSITEQAPPSRKDEAVMVTQITGRAEIQPSGLVLRSGEKLVAGVTVATAANSWLNLELFDGSRIIVQPGSVLRFIDVKRGITTGDKEIRFNLVSGQIFIVAQDFTGEHSLFQIRTPGVDIYVHGTAFEIAVSNKSTEAVAYQGELLMEDVNRGLLFPVVQGQKALLPAGGGTPAYSFHRLTAEMREDILRGEGFLSKEPTPKRTSSPGSTYRTGGVMTVSGGLGISNTKLVLKPQFYNIFDSDYSFGLELPFIFNQATGRIKFGENDPGTIIGPLLDWLKFENEVFFLNYDFFEDELTCGYGLLFGDYVSRYIRRTHFGLHGADGLRLEFLCPWNIQKVSPWDFDSTSLYAGRIQENFSFDRFSLQLGLTYVIDNDFMVSGIADQGLAVDAGFFVTKAFQPYVEGAVLKASDYGLGIEAGVLGETGAFRYRAAGRYLGKGFHPNYFGGDYEVNKANTLASFFGLDGYFYGKPLAWLDDPVYKAGMGYYVGFGVTAGEILSFDLSFEDANRGDQYFPILGGRVELALPALGPVPAVSAGIDCQWFNFSKFSEFPNTDTICFNYIEVMLYSGVYATYKSTYFPFFGPDRYMRELSFEVRLQK